MQRVNTIAKDISTTCSSNDATEANTTNSEWDYLKDLTDEDEKHYINNYIAKLREDGEDITRSISKLLETRSKLKKEGLMFYKEVVIHGYLISIYIQVGTLRDIKGFYLTFNGTYAIRHRDLYKLKIVDSALLEELLEDHNINCFS